MKKSIVTLPEINLITITVRTNNASEVGGASDAKIGPLIQKYSNDALPNRIPGRKKPGLTYCGFTEYESDFTGNYTYFIGEEVEPLSEVPEGFARIIVPEQTYAKFAIGPGNMPEVCVNSWRQIWQMTPMHLGGRRSYCTDFELYDYGTYNPKEAVFDIHVGIE